MKKWLVLGLFVALYVTGLVLFFNRKHASAPGDSSTATNGPSSFSLPMPPPSAATDLTAYVSVRQSYDGLPETNLPFAQVAARFLTYAGFNVSTQLAKRADLDMEILAQARPSSPAKKSELVLAAPPELNGTISIVGRRIKPKVVAFESKKALTAQEDNTEALTADTVDATALTHTGISPLTLVFNQTFPPRLAEMIGESYGGRPLIAALRDRDPLIRDAAEKALMAIVRANPLERDVAEMLADIMDDEESLMRGRVVKILGTTEDERLIPLYQGALRDADPLVRANAAEALGAFSAGEVADPLLTAMNDQDLRVRYRAAQSLGRIVCTQAVETLLGALTDPAHIVQEAAVESLKKIDDPFMTDRLLEMIEDPEKDVDRHAVMLLGQRRDPRSVEYLVSMLASDSPNVRDRAAESLGRIGDARAVDPLISALKDSDVFVRCSSADALRSVPTRKSIDPLIAALDDDNIMRLSVIHSLEKLTGRKLGENPEAWRAWWDSVKDSDQLRLPFEEPSATPEPPLEETIWPALTLGGVMKGRDGKPGTAVLNSRIMREGETIDGVTLLAVQADSAMLRYRGQNRKLMVNESIRPPAVESAGP